MSRKPLIVPWHGTPSPEEVEAFFHQVGRDLNPALHRVASAIVRDANAAEDIVQESLLKLLDALCNGGLSGDIAPWLHRTVRNRALDHSRKVDVRSESADIADLTDSFVDNASCLAPEERELTALLGGFVTELPELDRRILVLRYVEDRGYSDIAALVGCTERQARHICDQVRLHLHGQMEPYCPHERKKE